MSLIVIYFFHSTSVLSFYIDVVFTLSIDLSYCSPMLYAHRTPTHQPNIMRVFKKSTSELFNLRLPHSMGNIYLCTIRLKRCLAFVKGHRARAVRSVTPASIKLKTVGRMSFIQPLTKTRSCHTLVWFWMANKVATGISIIKKMNLGVLHSCLWIFNNCQNPKHKQMLIAI